MYFKKCISQFYIYEGLPVVEFKEFREARQHGSVRLRGFNCICLSESSYPFAKPCERSFDSACDGIGCELRDLSHAFAQVFEMFCEDLVSDIASNPYGCEIRRNEKKRLFLLVLKNGVILALQKGLTRRLEKGYNFAKEERIWNLI